MRKLKLLGICASARGQESNMYYLMKYSFGQIKDENIEKKIIVASELNILPCSHHYSINAKMCVHPCLITEANKKDEMNKIYDAILDADMVIFSTPIYWGNHSYLMQKIVERLNSLENMHSVHKKTIVKNKIAGLMILGHEDGYQHVAGNLMSFLTNLGMIFPPYSYAAWVGESDELTSKDRKRFEEDKQIKELFAGVAANVVSFALKVLICSQCGNKLDYDYSSKRKIS